MRHALVFGGSGQIGRPLLARLRRDGWRVSAVSRESHPDEPALQWMVGTLDAPPVLPAQVDVVFSCGPLDAFARWFAATRLASGRVVAFGSTSADTKRGSADPDERELAGRLRAAEASVLETAQARGIAVTLLRPTLVYGAGQDATLTRIATLARRWGCFPLPRHADGRRQPVHVDDLADAAFACIGAIASHGRTYALPGGETLSYREMVGRVLAVLEPPARLVELPAPLFNLALAAAQASGRATGLGEAAVRRMRTDLVFDVEPAHRDLGYAPRPFEPTARMFSID